MPVSTLTSKGQITLPAAYRRALGLKAGTLVSINLKDGVIVVDPRNYADRTAGMFKGRLSRTPTIAEMKQAAEDYSAREAMGDVAE